MTILESPLMVISLIPASVALIILIIRASLLEHLKDNLHARALSLPHWSVNIIPTPPPDVVEEPSKLVSILLFHRPLLMVALLALPHIKAPLPLHQVRSNVSDRFAYFGFHFHPNRMTAPICRVCIFFLVSIIIIIFILHILV